MKDYNTLTKEEAYRYSEYMLLAHHRTEILYQYIKMNLSSEEYELVIKEEANIMHSYSDSEERQYRIGEYLYSKVLEVMTFVVAPLILTLAFSEESNSIVRIISDSDEVFVKSNADILGAGAIRRYDNYRVLRFDEGLAVVEDCVAVENDNLEELFFPASVYLIKSKAFLRCKNLKYVKLENPECIIEAGAFEGASGSLVIE